MDLKALKAGMCTDDLLKVYNCVIRPVFEYAVATYHPMLSIEMSNQIENAQKRACKIVFGWDTSYETLVAENRVERLEERREKLVINFAKKTAEMKRFETWFPRRNYNGISLRRENKFEEFYARTERYRKSPLFYMRRELNKNVD